MAIALDGLGNLVPCKVSPDQSFLKVVRLEVFVECLQQPIRLEVDPSQEDHQIAIWGLLAHRFHCCVKDLDVCCRMRWQLTISCRRNAVVSAICLPDLCILLDTT